MTKACLVDWTDNGFVVPWMIFDTVSQAVEARNNSCSSWPYYVCEIEDIPSHEVFTRRASLSARNSPYRNEKTGAYKAVSLPELYYILQELPA